MSKPDWKAVPEDAEYARFWMDKCHWFKESPELKGMWMRYEHGKWVLTSMCNAVHISLIKREDFPESRP